jgi:xylose isomerase
MKREIDHLARLLHMAVDYKKKIGFKGQFYIEPKPREPSTHQYDSDAAACLNFLREYDLMEHFKLNIETNHATLAGHTMRTSSSRHATRARSAPSMPTPATRTHRLGHRPVPDEHLPHHEIMLEVLAMGGLTTGGLNFDAKCRRESPSSRRPLPRHIGGMDAFARGLKIAAARTLGVDAEILDAIMGHAEYTNTPRQSAMARHLFAVDELAGFIVACAKVRPDGLATLEPASVTKKLKTLTFAAAVSRQDIDQGIRELGVDPAAHIATCIAAIRDQHCMAKGT